MFKLIFVLISNIYGLKLIEDLNSVFLIYDFEEAANV